MSVKQQNQVRQSLYINIVSVGLLLVNCDDYYRNNDNDSNNSRIYNIGLIVRLPSLLWSGVFFTIKDVVMSGWGVTLTSMGSN